MHKTIERGDCTMDSQIRPYLMYKTIFLMMIVAKVTQSQHLAVMIMQKIMGLENIFSICK